MQNVLRKYLPAFYVYSIYLKCPWIDSSYDCIALCQKLKSVAYLSEFPAWLMEPIHKRFQYQIHVLYLLGLCLIFITSHSLFSNRAFFLRKGARTWAIPVLKKNMIFISHKGVMLNIFRLWLNPLDDSQRAVLVSHWNHKTSPVPVKDLMENFFNFFFTKTMAEFCFFCSL